MKFGSVSKINQLLRRKVFSARKKLCLVIPSTHAIVEFGTIDPMRVGLIACEAHKLSCDLYTTANFRSTASSGKLIGIVNTYNPVVKQQIH